VPPSLLQPHFRKRLRQARQESREIHAVWRVSSSASNEVVEMMFLPGPLELLVVSIGFALLWHDLRRPLSEAAASLRAQPRAQDREDLRRRYAVYSIVWEKAAREVAILVTLAALVIAVLLLR